MPSTKTNDRKVSVSFTNWVLGGSIVSLTSTDSENRHRRVFGRNVVISDVDSNGDEINVKQVENPKIEKKTKKKCKSCGKGKDGGDGGGKKDDKDKAQQDVGGKSKKEKDGGDKSKKDGKGGEKKSDESKEKPDNSCDSGGGRSSDWTDEKTSKLKEMKAANKSWKEITAELNTSQKDCKEKWKELQNLGKDKPHSGDAGKAEENTEDVVWGGDWGNGGAAADSGGTSNDWEKGGGGDSGAQSNGWDNGGAADTGAMDFGDLFGDSTNEPEKSNDSNGNNNTDWNDGGKKQRGKKNDKEVHWDGGRQSQNRNSGGNEWNSGAGPNGNSDRNTGGSGLHRNNGSSKQTQNHSHDGGGWNNSESNQQPKQQEQNSGRIGRLQPDEIWSKEDCEVLEMLMHRYTEYKWLQIKAGFFNWTGRMVSDEIIQKKFQDDGFA